jgi:predicted CoA-binding protein
MEVSMSVSETVAILGASSNPERYALKAQRLLKEKGHRVIPISLRESSVDGDPAVPSMDRVRETVDTLTVYVRPHISSEYREDIIRLHPRRVIFNPGTENGELEAALRAAGIESEEACTLVLLRTGQF